MAKDEFKNLGFGNDKEKEKASIEPKKDAEKGVKGELRW